MYLLDTDICSYIMKGTHEALSQRLKGFGWRELKVSTITQYELESGMRRAGRAEALIVVVESFLSRVDVLAFDAGAARRAALVRTELAMAGTPIGFYDTLIAGQALSLAATLVTNNVREFGRVDGLQIENWAA